MTCHHCGFETTGPCKTSYEDRIVFFCCNRHQMMEMQYIERVWNDNEKRWRYV